MPLLRKKQPDNARPLPRHLAVIMDGNNRWAKKRYLPALAGHRAGVSNVREMVRECGELGIEHLTLFAFSSENWRRPKLEVDGLMELFIRVLERETTKLKKQNVRLNIIGERSRLPVALQQLIESSEAQTADCTGLQLNVAANYGGRWDIAQATRKLAKRVAEGTLNPEDITGDMLGSELSLAGVPDPDLLIRTGGEQRISNFLVWQLAYTEFYFSDRFWPDFGAEELHQALESYGCRERRFGRTSEQLEAE